MSYRERDHSQIESALCEIWAELLDLPEVQPSDDFFELGGYSLLAIQITARIRGRYHVAVELEAFYNEPTIELLAKHIGRLIESGQPVTDEPIAAAGNVVGDLLSSIEEMSDEEVKAALMNLDDAAGRGSTDQDADDGTASRSQSHGSTSAGRNKEDRDAGPARLSRDRL